MGMRIAGFWGGLTEECDGCFYGGYARISFGSMGEGLGRSGLVGWWQISGYVCNDEEFATYSYY